LSLVSGLEKAADNLQGSQRLEFKGRILDNEDKLERYSISEGSLIFLRRATVFLKISHTIHKHLPQWEDLPHCKKYNQASFAVKPSKWNYIRVLIIIPTAVLTSYEKTRTQSLRQLLL